MALPLSKLLTLVGSEVILTSESISPRDPKSSNIETKTVLLTEVIQSGLKRLNQFTAWYNDGSQTRCIVINKSGVSSRRNERGLTKYYFEQL